MSLKPEAPGLEPGGWRRSLEPGASSLEPRAWSLPRRKRRRRRKKKKKKEKKKKRTVILFPAIRQETGLLDSLGRLDPADESVPMSRLLPTLFSLRMRPPETRIAGK